MLMKRPQVRILSAVKAAVAQRQSANTLFACSPIILFLSMAKDRVTSSESKTLSVYSSII